MTENKTAGKTAKRWPCGHTEDEHCFADTMFCVRDEKWFEEVQNGN